jgi:hypothetical protein
VVRVREAAQAKHHQRRRQKDSKEDTMFSNHGHALLDGGLEQTPGLKPARPGRTLLQEIGNRTKDTTKGACRLSPSVFDLLDGGDGRPDEGGEGNAKLPMLHG